MEDQKTIDKVSNTLVSLENTCNAVCNIADSLSNVHIPGLIYNVIFILWMSSSKRIWALWKRT